MNFKDPFLTKQDQPVDPETSAKRLAAKQELHPFNGATILLLKNMHAKDFLSQFYANLRLLTLQVTAARG